MRLKILLLAALFLSCYVVLAQTSSENTIFNVVPTLYQMQGEWGTDRLSIKTQLVHANSNVTCGLYNDHVYHPYNSPTSYMSIINGAMKTHTIYNIDALDVVYFKFSGLKAFTVYDVHCFGKNSTGDYLVSPVLHFATAPCSLGFFKDPETGVCIHNEFDVHEQLTDYGYKGSENWYGKHILEYYDMYEMTRFPDHNPDVVVNTQDAEGSFEQKAANELNDRSINRRYVEIDSHDGIEYDALGNFGGDGIAGGLTEEERFAEAYRLQNLYKADLTHDESFPTEERIFSFEHTEVDYD